MEHLSIPSPLGILTLEASHSAITRLYFPKTIAPTWEETKNPLLIQGKSQLEEYFAGIRREFSLPLLYSGSDFQEKIWSTLREIPYGTLWSYGTLAREIGKPTAFRAVGSACGKNPLPILLPCHRVSGAHGKIGGFSGGVPLKMALWKLEKIENQ